MDRSEKLKVLADQTRMAVVEMLMEGPSKVGRLSQNLGVEQSLLSHHLKVLRDAGIVVAERDGKAVLYRIAPDCRVESPIDTLNLGCCQLVFLPGPSQESVSPETDPPKQANEADKTELE